jgi:predicted DNA-binding transcriptional regulator AlpA
MERFLNQKEVAKLFGVSTRTLERHRGAGTGPRYIIVLGKLVRYRQSDLADYVESNLRSSTSDSSLANDRPLS